MEENGAVCVCTLRQLLGLISAGGSPLVSVIPEGNQGGAAALM